MALEADLHNFGQFVQKVGRASGVYYQKPRPLYWEWLFFGKTSPLAKFFVRDGRIFQPRNMLFNLETEMNSEFRGSSKEVVQTSIDDIHDGHFYSFGVLLAYCYIFGIRDLHRHNVLRTDTHLQVVDAEVVLVKLLLPNETLLLPFKNIDSSLSSVSLLRTLIPNHLLPAQRAQIFIGCLDTFECVFKSRDGILAEFKAREQEMKPIPVRHILRDTFEYLNWMEQSPIDPYFDSEIEQLRRGDIPYFFKFIDDDRLYAYTDSSSHYRAVDVPDVFLRAVERDATNPNTLLSRSRLDSIFAVGILFLAKQMFEPNQIGPFKFSDIEFTLTSNFITFKYNSHTYQAERK